MPALSADFLESMREPGTSRLSPSRLAALLAMPQQDLAALAGVHRNTLRMHSESPRLPSHRGPREAVCAHGQASDKPKPEQSVAGQRRPTVLDLLLPFVWLGLQWLVLEWICRKSR